MESLTQLEIIIMLLGVMLALTTLSRRLLIPYPILLVIGGLVHSLIPGLPTVRLNSDLIFLVFLPPILWAAAYFTSLREFRANLRPISMLAVGVVLATTAAVAAIAHWLLPGLSWAAAIVLGAIVSPPDAVAATAIARRLGIPRRLVTILEGESLVNDATALVLYRTAIGAVVTGTFVWSDTLLQLAFTTVTGIALGLIVGAATRGVLRLTEDSFVESALTLLAPYVAWVLAEMVHASGVLACVAGGFYVRQYFSAAVAPTTRQQSRAVWDIAVFILNGIIFILIGLQLGAIREEILSSGLTRLLWHSALISVTAIIVRLAWVPLTAYLPRLLMPSLRARDPMPPTSHLFLVGWTGMRGIVSLAAALALPLTVSSGAPFPYRADIIVMTFGVILATLVVQGLSLTPIIRMLKLEADESLEHEEALVRQQTATAALNRLDALMMEHWAQPDHVDRLRVHYNRRVERFAKPGDTDPDCSPQGAESFRRLRHETLTAERLMAIALRDQGVISDEVLHRIEQELDVEAIRLGIGDIRPNGSFSSPVAEATYAR